MMIMPYKSNAQERYFNTPEGRAKVGAKVVDEFNDASKYLKLPAKAKSRVARKVKGK
jgi:hypothetical protein